MTLQPLGGGYSAVAYQYPPGAVVLPPQYNTAQQSVMGISAASCFRALPNGQDAFPIPPATPQVLMPLPPVLAQLSPVENPPVTSLCCPSGHPVTPTVLRFYQGYVYNRTCHLCRVRISRDELRHRCELCDYDVCRRCFERFNLVRVHTGLIPTEKRVSVPVTMSHVQPLRSVTVPNPGKAFVPLVQDEVVGQKTSSRKSGTRSGTRSGKSGRSESSDDESGDEIPEAALHQESDALAGRGLFQIPQASPDIQLRDGREGLSAEPPRPYDLRRFIRPGDIINYHGGNAWGHTVLVLATPRVVEVPILVDAEPSVAVLDTRVPAYVLKVLQSASNMLEICISNCCLVVHPLTKQICAAKDVRGGVRLSSGRDGNPIVAEVLLSPFSEQTLDANIFRLAVEEVQRAPQDSKWSFKTAVRSYLKKADLKAEKYMTNERKLRLAAKLNDRWRERPVCSTIPPRVWQKYFLKRCQQERQPLPSLSCVGYPIHRGRGSGSHLLYCGKPLSDVEDQELAVRNTRVDSCCISPVAQPQLCGPWEGPQCIECLKTQAGLPSDAPDPEVAWAEDVLRMMPVKDDRVLPDELCKVLRATRLWHTLDFSLGPPSWRQGIGPFQNEAFYRRILEPYRRNPLPEGIRNAEGAPVQFGQNQFTVYCGRQVAKPQQLVARLGQQTGQKGEVFTWDGRCGPSEGPQCLACRRLEDRLLS